MNPDSILRDIYRMGALGKIGPASLSGETADNQIEFLKTLFRIAITQDAVVSHDALQFYQNFIDDETVSVIEVFHPGGFKVARITTDMGGDTAVFSVPLQTENEPVEGNFIKTGMFIESVYQGDLFQLKVTEDLKNALENTSSLGDAADNYPFTNDNSEIDAHLQSEQSLQCGHYAKQRLLDLIQGDPYFKIDALLTNGNVSEAISVMQENSLPFSSFKRDVAIAISREPRQIPALYEMVSYGFDALLDEFTPREISILFTQKLTNLRADAPNVVRDFQYLAQGSSPENIQRLIRSTSQLAFNHKELPEDLMAWANMEILSGIERATFAGYSNKRLKI